MEAKLSDKEIIELAHTRCGTRKITVHVVVRQGTRTLLVHNTAKQLQFKEERGGKLIHPEKPEGWGIVTGSVKPFETPLEGVRRELTEETRPKHQRGFRGFAADEMRVEPIPIFGTRKENRSIELTFLAHIDPHCMTPESWDVNDSAAGVIRAAWLHAPEQIHQSRGQHQFRGLMVYSNHVRIIKQSGVLTNPQSA